ncbi:hypothetical protein LZC95_34185 [Pendulispora brunnea]|uniref:Secreted protein n=1 Tax=Pendulispora brunnea TaxID=2905690 RepID=A0ABZ2K3X5_9BACT
MTAIRPIVLAASLVASAPVLGVPQRANADTAEIFDDFAPYCIALQSDTVGQSPVHIAQSCVSVIPESTKRSVVLSGTGAGADGIVHVLVTLNGQEFARGETRVINPSSVSPWSVSVQLPPGGWYVIRAWTTNGNGSNNYAWVQLQIG